MVDFEPWGIGPFKRALAEEKPILLSISATWCHWCHEMDRLTYENPQVIDFLKENFIAVRVDTDKRPDINARYNQGGWPSTVFLNHRGEVITGATFLPPQDFLTMADQVRKIYKELIIKGQVSRILGEEEEREPLPGSGVSLEVRQATWVADRENFLYRFESEVKDNFDPFYGGFGQFPKFPHVEVLEFCLKRFQQTGDKDFSHIIRASLEAYSQGRLFDHLEGGFFRYSVDQMFENVHSEKLLADNLKLALIFHQAGCLFNEKSFLEVSERTVDFLKNWLWEEPFYFASVDAKEDYYASISREERQKIGKPSVDRTIFADLNGLSSSTLWQLGRVEEAETIIRQLFSDFRDEQGFFNHFLVEPASTLRLLSDQVYPLLAFTQILTTEKQTISDLLRLLLLNFYDEQRGGFFDRLREETEIGLLKVRMKPLEENLILVDLLGKFGYQDRARKTLLEIFDLNREPSLRGSALAISLIEGS